MGKDRNIIQFLVTFCILCGFFAAFYYLTAYAMPDKNENMITFMLGQISGLASIVVNYWFGSTNSSKKKDEILASAMAGTDSTQAADKQGAQ